jgi:hypothetical protein
VFGVDDGVKIAKLKCRHCGGVEVSVMNHVPLNQEEQWNNHAAWQQHVYFEQRYCNSCDCDI